MSDAMMTDFMRITDSFSGEELVSAISILSEKLKKMFANSEKKANISKEEQKLSKEEQTLRELFAHADSLHLRSDGTKWTREELYER